MPKLKIIKNNSHKLFTGPANGEVMIDTFLRYKDPAVQELTDTTFEHLTQVQPGGLPAYLPGLYTYNCLLRNNLQYNNQICSTHFM